jgi:hypothetical protein
MKIRIDEDYYRWNCEWCDTENRVLWIRVHEGLTCGACHRAAHLGGEMLASQEAKISAGLY